MERSVFLKHDRAVTLFGVILCKWYMICNVINVSFCNKTAQIRVLMVVLIALKELTLVWRNVSLILKSCNN